MNKKLNIVLLGILAVSLMVSTASAATVDDHAAGIGTMAHPTSSSGIAVCGGCHGTVGSATTTGFCTGCHGFPTFTLRVSATPTSVTAGTSTPVAFTVRNGPTNGPLVTGALVSLSGAGVPTGTSGTTVISGLTTISVNAASAGTIIATATKTASYTSGTTTVTANAVVQPKVLTTVTISPLNPSVVAGTTRQFTGAPLDQNNAPIGATLSWSSSNNSVGTINSAGLFTAAGAGTATITVAAVNGTVTKTNSTTVTVTSATQPKVLTTVAISPLNPSVVAGTTRQFTGTPLDQNKAPRGATLSWSSSNNSVGTINSVGLFTASGAGTATITVAAVNGTVTKTNSTTVTVTSATQPKVLTTVTISPLNPSVVAGTTRQFTGTPLDQNNAPRGATLSWSSSNNSVGTINSVGLFTAAGAGTATITVAAVNGTVTKTNSTTVTVTSTPTGSFSVTFIVTDKRTGKPIHDAKISLDGITKKSDDDGKVKFSNVVSGIHSYKISKEHYLTITGSINVTKETKISVKLVRGEDVNHHEERND